MYTPKNMEMPDIHSISAFISEFGFGTLITQDLEATRLPLIFDTSENESGCIIGHMARANPQWKDLSRKKVSVLFNGPHSYISPTWYSSKPAVPTWNYASVHCFGIFHELDATETLRAINSLVHKYEPEILDSSELMPQEYIQRLLKAVVGFKVVVTEIHGKEKLGQHKKSEDQVGVYKALLGSQNNDSVQLANYMKQRGVGQGS